MASVWDRSPYQGLDRSFLLQTQSVPLSIVRPSPLLLNEPMNCLQNYSSITQPRVRGSSYFLWITVFKVGHWMMESWKQPNLSETQKKKRRGSHGPSRYEWRIQIKHKPSGRTPNNWDSVGGGESEVLIIEYSDDDYMKTIVSVMTMIILMKIIMLMIMLIMVLMMITW